MYNLIKNNVFKMDKKIHEVSIEMVVFTILNERAYFNTIAS